MKESFLETVESETNYLESVFHFLRELGIGCCISEENFDSFLQGVRIENGGLKINLKNLLCIGDILHEAGHLACLPSDLRAKANDNIEISLGPEHTYELGAIMWSVAAAMHLKIPLTEIFHEDAYRGDGQWLLEQYSNNNYLGLNLLQWMGMVAFDDEVDGVNILPFPAMLRWTRI